MDVALRVFLVAAAAALAAVLAHDARAVYHDGLRMLVREGTLDRSSRTRLAAEGWRMSSGFVAWFALPVSLLSGVMVAHLVFLPADILGVRLSGRPAAAAAAGLYGAIIAATVAGAGLLVRHLPYGIATIPGLFGETAASLVPLIPIVAALRLDKGRYGLPAALLGVSGWVAADAAGLDRVVLPTILACIPLVVAAARFRPVDVSLDTFAGQFARVRSSTPSLVLFAGLVGALGALLFLAGEPLAAWLLVSGQASAAATVAILTAAAFMPLVATSAMSSGVYSTQGYPDWLLAPGYLLQNPIGAPLAGALMVSETFGLRTLCGLIVRHPEISSVAAALRAASEDVLVLTGIVGGALAAFGNWGTPGLYGFGALYLANQATRGHVPPLAIGPVAILTLCVVRVGWGIAAG